MQLRRQAEAVLVEVAQHQLEILLKCCGQGEAIVVDLRSSRSSGSVVVRYYAPGDDAAKKRGECGQHRRVCGDADRAELTTPISPCRVPCAVSPGFHNFSILSSLRCELPAVSTSSGASACQICRGASGARSA